MQGRHCIRIGNNNGALLEFFVKLKSENKRERVVRENCVINFVINSAYSSMYLERIVYLVSIRLLFLKCV